MIDDAQSPTPLNLTFAAHDAVTAVLNAWREDVGKLTRRLAEAEHSNQRLMRQLAENSKQLKEQREINDVVSGEVKRLKELIDTRSQPLADIREKEEAHVVKQTVVLPHAASKHVLMESYSPRWATHVTGTYRHPASEPEAGDDVGEYSTVIKIALSCSKCGDTSETRCTQGQPRTQIANYARGHMHP